ncbi:MAG: dioxygenase, partial [Bdellovibrionales bacterium]|nr:dioxygenase [Bdellovibrionales bacterium]
ELNINPIHFTDRRGLDHGTWAVLYHMYPNAEIPVAQMSIPRNLSFFDYFKLGRQLRELRKFGVMIIGSGNIVHNLQKINWQMDAPSESWALEFDKLVEESINTRNYEQLFSVDHGQRQLFQLAHPTPEHFVPLLYVLGTLFDSDRFSYPCSFIQNATISMRSILFTS